MHSYENIFLNTKHYLFVSDDALKTSVEVHGYLLFFYHLDLNCLVDELLRSNFGEFVRKKFLLFPAPRLYHISAIAGLSRHVSVAKNDRYMDNDTMINIF